MSTANGIGERAQWRSARLTGANGGLAFGVDLVEEFMAGNTTVSSEGVHHATIGRNRESAAEEHGTDDDDL